MSNYFDIYAHLTSPLTDPDFLPLHARVILRADLNVPIINKKVVDDARLRRLLPTLDALLARKAHIRILTHIGTPDGFDAAYSTAPLATWFKQQGYTLATKKSSQGAITVEENIRFDPREQEPDASYAHVLLGNSDYYINDAFGSVHRHDTSLTLLAQQCDSDKRGIGLLMQNELHTLGALRTQPKRPLVIVLGGGKIDKLTTAAHLLTIADMILLCPMLGPVVSSFHLHEVHDAIAQLTNNPKVYIPVDYRVSTTYPWRPPFHVVPAAKLTGLHLTVGAGPATIAAWQPLLEQAGTIIVNGPMGDISLPESTVELRELFSIIAHSAAYSVAGGGDTLHALDAFNLTSSFSYCSTGGGSMLAYLAGEQLPALDALIE